MTTRQLLWAAVVTIVGACSAIPATSPGPQTSASPFLAPTSTAVLTTAPTATVAPTATAPPTPTRSPSRTTAETPRPVATLEPYQNDVAAPGTLNLSLDEFTVRWNAVAATDELKITMGGWQTGLGTSGDVAAHYFTDADLPDLALTLVINDDGSVRSATVLYAPPSGPRNYFEEFTVVAAHQTLADAVLPAGPDRAAERDAVLEALEPAAGTLYTGVDAAISVAGVRFRLVDAGAAGVLFITRQDNLGG